MIEINPNSGEIDWEYKDDPPVYFYSSMISGCQRLPNGNTLICEGAKGRFFEVTARGEIVWEYINPFFFELGRRHGHTNQVFRAHRYGPDYAGLKGTGLDDMNLVYGPAVYQSMGMGPAAPRVKLESAIVEEGESRPSVRTQAGDITEQEKRVRSRLADLGD